jgi:starch-binding outer membrane protein, SusD/RagB family
MKLIQIISGLFFVCLSTACHKEVNIETKPSSRIFIPGSPDELQGLLDNSSVFGFGAYLSTISADEFIYTDNMIGNLSSEKKAYTWQDKMFDEKEEVSDWNSFFTQIYYSNVVLEGVQKGRLENKENETQFNLVQGDALFKRAIAYFTLAQMFCRPYDTQTSPNDPGIPLRLTSDNKETLSRGTVKETYNQILADLNTALPLLPTKLNNKFRNRGSQPAAWAMIARTYLSMRDYPNAAKAAESCLNLYDSLIDFNEINSSTSVPFTSTNKETLYQIKMPVGNFIPALRSGLGYINPNLLSLYASEDLRQLFFFNKFIPYLKSSFSGDIYPFSGLANDEVYLILAESYIATGQTIQGLSVLNKLLRTRWEKGKFIPYADTTTYKARQAVLSERQKELLFRGQRWSDLRRLNKEGFKIDLERTVNGVTYHLRHNEYDRFVLPLPENILKYGYAQNIR